MLRVLVHNYDGTRCAAPPRLHLLTVADMAPTRHYADQGYAWVILAGNHHVICLLLLFIKAVCISNRIYIHFLLHYASTCSPCRQLAVICSVTCRLRPPDRSVLPSFPISKPIQRHSTSGLGFASLFHACSGHALVIIIRMIVTDQTR